jgi:hypothetical protein
LVPSVGVQDLIVFAIVAGAVWFLVRRVTARRRERARPAESFVPLDSLRKRDGPGCH